MRLETTVDIQVDEKTTKTYRVYELHPLDAVKLHQEDGSIMDLVKKVLPRVSDITLDELQGLFPSEQELLFEAFKKVNAPFLKAAKALGILEGLDKIKSLLLNEFKSSVVGSLKQAMPDLGNTDSPSSLSRPKKTSDSRKNADTSLNG